MGRQMRPSVVEKSEPMTKKSFRKFPKIGSALVESLVLLAVFPVPANAYPRPGITERVSLLGASPRGSKTPNLVRDQAHR